jgi:hypothetical protein
MVVQSSSQPLRFLCRQRLFSLVSLGSIVYLARLAIAVREKIS